MLAEPPSRAAPRGGNAPRTSDETSAVRLAPGPSRVQSLRRANTLDEEVSGELLEIKREIVESRGLVIKTNNLTNALAADLKSITKRQQAFERRAFWNSWGANALFVLVVIAVVALAWDARMDNVEAKTKGAQ
ncbi:MAG: hypothetical protein R3B70_49530, partial [Polyangiaceae bacterium]